MNTTTVSLTIQTVSTLPSGWTDGDIGSTGVAGNASYASGVFTVKGAGAQMYGTADGFHYVYQPLTGDGTIVARLVSVQGAGSGYAAAGVMIRETLDGGSTNAITSDWATYIYFDVRTATGGSTSQTAFVSAAVPYWMKVSRSGSTFSSYTSSDGVNWTQLGASQTITMGQSVNVGLAVTSGSTSALTTATFDNVSLTAP
jgi:regulation of enolase protein 1 (concanavalin A-like superfamily)